MAERRMFAKTIVLSDAFLDMPMSARCLYFTLGMLADDEGFVGNPKSIMRQTGCSQDDMMMLLHKRYVLGFDSGVIVIKHWRLNNYLQSDRIKTTTYLEEKDTLKLDEKGSYTEKSDDVYKMDTKCIHSIDKNSIEENSIEENSIEKIYTEKPTRHKYGEYKNVLLSDEEYEKLSKEIPKIDEWIEKVSSYMASTGKTYKNYSATIRNWYKKDNPHNSVEPSYDLSKFGKNSIKYERKKH